MTETFRVYTTMSRCGSRIEVGGEYSNEYQCELHADHKSSHWYTEHHRDGEAMAIVWRGQGQNVGGYPLTPCVEQ